MFQTIWPKVRDHLQPLWAKRLEQKMDRLMTQITDLQASLDGIAAQVPTIASGVASIEAQLAALQNSPTSTLSASDQTALNQATSDVATIKTALNNISASLPAPASVAAPAAATVATPAS